MFDELMHMLRVMKPANILLIQACIVILIPYLLWRTMQLGRWFPHGGRNIQILIAILAGVIILLTLLALFT